VGPWGLVLVVVVVAAVVYFAYSSWKADQKRRELLMTWATNSGFSFAVEDDSLCDRWHATPFGEGDHRRARNVVTGTNKDRPFVAFDYSYQTHSQNSNGTQSTTTHRYVVTALQLPMFLPQLQVTPENLFTRVGNAFGLDDIELESEEFNRRFRVHARDRKFACDVLTPRTMQMLLSQPVLSWRIDGIDVIAWQDGRLSPSLCLSTTSQLQDIVDGIPSFVWHDHEMGGPA
jgi:Protein of unknown function (DUF3137)